MGNLHSKRPKLRSGLITPGPWWKLQSKSALGAAGLIIALALLMSILRGPLFNKMLEGAPLHSVVRQIEVLSTWAVPGSNSDNWVRYISARMYAGVITIVAMAAAAIGIVTVTRFLYLIAGSKLTILLLTLALILAHLRGPAILRDHRLIGEPFDAIAKQAKLDTIFDGLYWTIPRFVGFIPVFYFVMLFVALCFRANNKWRDPKELRIRIGVFYVSMAMSAILLMLGVLRNMSRLAVISMALPDAQSANLYKLSQLLCFSYGISLSAIAIAALVPCLYCINRDIDSAAAEAVGAATPKTAVTFKSIHEWRDTHGLAISLPTYASVVLAALAPIAVTPILETFKGIHPIGPPASHDSTTSGSK
jgi:hypothetical protein